MSLIEKIGLGVFLLFCAFMSAVCGGLIVLQWFSGKLLGKDGK